jgi:hypothetical protein
VELIAMSQNTIHGSQERGIGHEPKDENILIAQVFEWVTPIQIKFKDNREGTFTSTEFSTYLGRGYPTGEVVCTYQNGELRYLRIKRRDKIGPDFLWHEGPLKERKGRQIHLIFDKKRSHAPTTTLALKFLAAKNIDWGEALVPYGLVYDQHQKLEAQLRLEEKLKRRYGSDFTLKNT